MVELLTEVGRFNGIKLLFSEKEGESNLIDLSLMSSTYAQNVSLSLQIVVTDRNTKSGLELFQMQ